MYTLTLIDSDNFDVVIIGGGIAGLTTACALVGQGLKILIVDQGEFGQQASWAGGGILSPLRPWRYSLWHSEMTIYSLSELNKLQSQLGLAGFSFEWLKRGMLYLDEPFAPVKAWQQNAAGPVVLLEGRKLSQHIRKLKLAGAPQQAVWLPEVGSVRSPRLIKACVAYLRLCSDVTLQSYCQAKLAEPTLIEPSMIANSESTDGLRGVRLTYSDAKPDARVYAKHIVVASGAWTDQVLMTGSKLVQPVRGQMLCYETGPALQTIVMAGEHYLLPRADGAILAGSTTEHVDFDTGTTSQARSILRSFSVQIVPGLARIEPSFHWSGLRPMNRAGEQPLLGPLAPGLWLNTGHFKNGIVHAPGAARLIADGILNRPIVLAWPSLIQTELFKLVAQRAKAHA